MVSDLNWIAIILQVMSVKALGTSLKLTFEGKNQLIYPETWFFMLVVAICVIMQMNYLNKVCYPMSLKISMLGFSCIYFYQWPIGGSSQTFDEFISWNIPSRCNLLVHWKKSISFLFYVCIYSILIHKFHTNCCLFLRGPNKRKIYHWLGREGGKKY